MAKKPTISNISSGYASTTTLNNNFTALRDGFDNTLSRDGSTPNSMAADLDMNSNDILNVQSLDVQGLTIGGTSVFPNTAAISTTYATQTHTGDGTTTTFAMGFNPAIKANVDAHIDGVYQNIDTFSISGTNLTFSEAPPLNSKIEIKVPVNVTSLTNTDPSQIVYNQGGTGAQDRTLTSKLQDFVSRNDFDNDTNFTAAGTTASAKLNQIDFYKTSASGANSQILPTDRGLTFTPTLTNQRPAFNAAPNGTPSGTNTAYSVMRVWGQDIVNDPTGSRQALAMEMHYGSDSVLRSRLNTRSEGSPTLDHPDFYWQINGANCFYTGRKRDGTTGRTNMGFFPRGFGFRDTLATVYWSASEAVTTGTTRLLTNSDFLYLECSVGGTTGSTEPDATAIGTSFTDGTVTWDVKTKFFLAGSSETTDAIPAIWMNEAGNTGFGTQSPVASYEFANRARFDGGIEFDDGTNVGATLNNIFTATVTTDFTGSLAAGASSTATTTLTGAALGDVVQMGLAKDNIIDDLVFTAYVSAANQVAIKCQNVGSGTVALTSETYRLAVLKF